MVATNHGASREGFKPAGPVLLVNRDQWRGVWPLAVMLTNQHANYWCGYERTAETTIEAWAAVAPRGSVMPTIKRRLVDLERAVDPFTGRWF